MPLSTLKLQEAQHSFIHLSIHVLIQQVFIEHQFFIRYQEFRQMWSWTLSSSNSQVSPAPHSLVMNDFNWAVKVKSLSFVQLFATPWTVAHQAPQSMEFSRQAYWSGLPFPSAGDLPNPGIESGSLALQTDALPSEPLTVTQWYWCGITLWAERS